MSETILKVEDLKTSFMTSSGEVQAVRGVSFEVHKGEILGIVGESCACWPILPALKTAKLNLKAPT